MRKILGKKGFSLLELVVSIAIIGVLLAMILPSLSTRDANKKASISAAKDFYSATQSLFSKYSKYEDYLYYGQKDELAADKVIDYVKDLGGNFPKNAYTALAMKVENSKIVYVDAISLGSPTLAEMAMYSKSGVATETNFEKMFAKDIEPLFYLQDGMYYAYIYFVSNANATLQGETNTNTVRVLAAAYCPTEFPPSGDDYNDFMENYLLLTDNGLNAKGMFLGVCSSTKDTNLDLNIGAPGSYFSLKFKSLVSP